MIFVNLNREMVKKNWYLIHFHVQVENKISKYLEYLLVLN